MSAFAVLKRSGENLIQRAVFEHLRVRGAPGLFVFHVPNGGKRDRTEAAILKSLGVRAGVPDIFAVHQGRCFAIELKTAIGRPSSAQREAIAALQAAGAIATVCYGLNAALRTLESWGLLRGSAQ
jgi:hypothetical protein